MRNYDTLPTLSDTEIIEFCAKGFLMLDGVVSDETNRRTVEFLDEHSDSSDIFSPIELLNEDWFVDNVVLQPDAAGAIRSLLGKDFRLPNMMANHRTELPQPAQDWHFDGGSMRGHELNYLQVFYYPQECTKDMGPTELLPGSHFLWALRTYISHLGGIRGTYHSVASAGSIFITVYSIWHRRSASTGSGIRNLLKYNYWRTVKPERDWIIKSDFDIANVDFSVGDFNSVERPSYRQQFRDCYDSAEMYAWLSGKHDEFKLLGGQGWPMPNRRLHKWIGRPYGIPEVLQD